MELNQLYAQFNEEFRLSKSRSSRIEFYTTLNFIKKYLQPKDDFVLCLGPLYHLSSSEDKMKCVQEAKRVCKPEGILFFAYISNDMVFVTETMLYNPNFLNSDHYTSAFKINDGPFCFMTVVQMCRLMKNNGLLKVAHFAADGLSELMEDRINSMSDEQFQEWLNFHFYTCEKPECLGFSNHIVYVARNKKG